MKENRRALALGTAWVLLLVIGLATLGVGIYNDKTLAYIGGAFVLMAATFMSLPEATK